MMKINPKKWWWMLLPNKRKIIRAAEFWINQESISVQSRLELNHLMAKNTPMHIFPHFDFKSLQDEVDYIASIDDDYWKE